MKINDILYKWYQENGLDPWEFQCTYEKDCSRDALNFTTARPPLIGNRFADGKMPRLLVVSSDPGRGDKLPENRGFTLSGADPTDYKSNKHWSETLKLVHEIQKQFDLTLSPIDASSCFVHERAVKCCVNNHRSREANWRLFRNCHSYIPQEILVLQPDIVVSQGNRATYAVQTVNFHEKSPWTKCGEVNHGCYFRILTLPKNHKALWLYTYHPTSRSKYYPAQKDGYFKCYPELAWKFINDHETFMDQYSNF